MRKALFPAAGLVLAGVLIIAQPGASAKLNNHAAVCPPGGSGVRCHAQVVIDPNGSPHATTTPSGYGPAQFLGAYGLSGTSSSSPIIAIVDAYDQPNIKSDLDKYSSTFGIPTLPTCVGPIASSTVPCFQKINQNGGTVYPATNAGWALEISLDVEAAHAVCQNCKILLTEANSSSFADLTTAVDQAVSQGAKVISNSYGASEFAGENTYDSHYNHPGLAITFSSGDSGYGTQYPAASPYVVAVGGTTLNLSGTTYLSESVWSGAGSGCSTESKPSWQTDSGCAKRTIADVSADANPNTGAAVYDSVRYQGRRGWFQVGGTSLASPLVAATYALGGVPTGTEAGSLPYSSGSASTLHDVTTGSNGNCGTYLCNGATGYDGPSGLGTPKGTGAF